MRKNYLFAFLLFVGLSANAQVINFSDATFKSLLIGANPASYTAKDVNGNSMTIDANWNNEIELSEALNVYEIMVLQNTNQPYIVSVEGIQYFTNLRKLWVSDQHLSYVNCSPLVNLEEINFTYNQLVGLNLTGLTHLKKINCSNNVMTSLNTSDLISLENLECSGNQITSLDLSNSVNLQKLSCLYNNLTSLSVAGLSHLTEINCENNHLPTLNLTGLTSLVDFRCGANQMTSLSLPDSNGLKVLFCGSNQLTSLTLSNLPLITNLACGYNLLTSVDLSNQVNLVSLYCNHNLLTQLDVSNTILIELFCEENNIQSIDVSACTNLYRFTCSNNPNLTYLNLKNGSTANYYLFMNNVPNLTYVCVDEDEYYDVYNKMHYYSGSPHFEINSYCSFTPGGIFYTIMGNQKIDADNNGCDVNDLAYPNLKFSITDGTNTGNFISNASGDYSIPLFAATHTITPILENPSYFTVTPPSFSVTFPTQASPFTQNFCIAPNGSHQDVETWIVPLTPARAGFDARYKIFYKNKGSVTVTGSLSFAFDDDDMDFISATPIQNNQSYSLLSWNYSNLLPFEIREIEVTVNINSPMETPAVNNGDFLKFSSTIFPLTGDEYPNNNSIGLNQIVVGSFDPNDKTCIEGRFVEPEMIGEYVHYVIRFENTGTFAAENIVVKDIIDETKFDISTLVPLNASHNFTTRIAGSKVEFIFENINLPFDDENNDGYVAFKIKTKSTLALGNTFSNTASIYFDYNFPIITNTTATTIQRLANQDFEFSKYFTLYPNPANETLHIKSSNSILVHSLSIYNTLGQLLMVVANPIDTIDVLALKSGNYYLKISSDKGTTSSRFVKI